MPSLRALFLVACLVQPLAAQQASVETRQDQIVVSIGPVHIPARLPYDHHVAAAPVEVAWPASGWMHGYRVDIVDSAGRVLPRALLHHAAVVNLGRRQLLYPTAERLLAVGQETEEVILPGSMGVPMTIGARLLVYYALVNPGQEDVHGATLRITTKWRADGDAGRSRSVFPVAFDALPLVGAPSTFDIPPGRSSVVSEFTVPAGGRLRQLGAHLHDHGVEARLEEVATGRVLVRLAARRDDDGRVLSVQRTGFLVMLRGVRLDAGQRYRVVGVYDNPTCSTIAGGMAGIGGVFEPDELRDWPRLDLANDDYQKDLRWLATAGASGGAHHEVVTSPATGATCDRAVSLVAGGRP